MIRTVGSRRRTARPPVFYWPVAGPFLLAAVVVAVLLIALLQVGIVTYALAGSRVAGDISAPGSHGSEREPLGSLRSSHLTHSNVPVHFQCAKRPRSRATSPSHHFFTRLNEASRRYFLRAQRTR